MPSNPAFANPASAAALAMFGVVEKYVPFKSKLDSLTSFAQTQLTYYKDTLHVADPSLGPYEALGAAYALEHYTANQGTFDGMPMLQNRFEAFTMPATISPDGKIAYSFAPPEQAIAKAYDAIFHRAITPEQTTFFKAQNDYFKNLYLQAGTPADQATMKAGGAVFGPMVGYAMNDPAEYSRPEQVLDNQVSTVLVGLANGSVSYASSWPTA